MLRGQWLVIVNSILSCSLHNVLAVVGTSWSHPWQSIVAGTAAEYSTCLHSYLPPGSSRAWGHFMRVVFKVDVEAISTQGSV